MPTNYFLVSAALIAAVGFCAHFFVGGPTVARPLLKAEDIATIPKLTNYYCWHLVSLSLLAMAAGFAICSYEPHYTAHAVLWTALSASFFAWNIILVLWKRQKLFDLPQWIFFAPITIFGVIGLGN
ncbi:MAG: hypothetical protein L3J82_08885 [Planctomycetes bacterium]|nr:hypothetical protein [Planctomycetota bacterium]